MKDAFEDENNALKAKNAKRASQLRDMKEELTKSQKELQVKTKDVAKLKVQVNNITIFQTQSPAQTVQAVASNNELVTKPFMGKKLVHFDLKGAPPKIDYLIKIMKFAKELGADGFLIEYEDMFPWDRELKFLRSKHAYTKEDITKILEVAKTENLIVVPLIQTFGHLEFVLKHKDFSHLRADKEITNVICPINEGSVPLIKKMISQVLELHPDTEFIHLGGDEVYNLRTCEKCKKSGWDDFQLYTHHMIPIFDSIKTKKSAKGAPVKAIVWDDMLRKWDLLKLKTIAQYVTPMVWAYVPDLSTYHNFPDGMWDRFGTAFPELWIASSFKGALKPWSNFVPIKQHLDNHLSWLKIIASLEKVGSKVVGVAITGWSRFDHYGPLCELLPAGIPSLALCLAVLTKGKFDSDLHKAVSEKLQFSKPFQIGVTYFKGYKPESAGYSVGGSVYELVGSLEKAIGWYDWSNVRITGWTRPYNKQRKFLSFFQLNTTLFGLNQSKEQLSALKVKASTELSPIFDEDTVNEWIEDKIGYYLKIVSDALVETQALKMQYNFT